MEPQDVDFDTINHTKESSERMLAHLKNPKNCDVAFKISGETEMIFSNQVGEIVYGLKVLLSAHSPVFAAMFNGKWKDASKPEIELDSTTHEGCNLCTSLTYHSFFFH